IALRFEQTPLAATALALLLRGSENRSVEEGLVAESAAYSTLQAGPEFTRWRAAHAIRDRPVETEPAVRVERIGDVIVVRLSRPHVRNAFSARMRDELLEALGVAQADPGLTVELRGDGPSFSAGGDLDEFGTRPDPATAHLARLKASPARVIASLRDRVTAYLHGACYGSGIELPAFAGRVIAARDTQIALPELHLGLIPGAGGTVSIVRRIGRHRTASLVLSGRAIDAPTALEWGLVDAIE
ncbi:MAG: hypothetical protein QOE80_1599, partial [Actinomycetota bacterium]|nr:hypothetical protein [Actinomycetota bacterium]